MRGLSSEGRQVQIGTRPRRNRAKEQFWRKVVAEQRRSRLTVRAFCESRGLTEPSFYAWRAELRGAISGSVLSLMRPAPAPHDERWLEGANRDPRLRALRLSH